MKREQSEQGEVLATCWLTIATRGLCDQAKARITVEIKSHYQEAVKTHLAEGESPVDAKVSALDELGNPEVAAKRFRKKHLSEKEAKKLGALRAAVFAPYTRRRIIFEILFLAVFIAGMVVVHSLLPSSPRHAAQTWSFVFMLIMGVTFFTGWWMSRFLAKPLAAHSVTSRIVRNYLLCSIAGDVGNGAAMLMVFQLESIALTLLFTSALVAVFVINNSVPWLRIWLKVRRDTTFWDVAYLSSNQTGTTSFTG